MLGLADAPAQGVDLVERAHLVLYVVPHFVCNHVGFGKVAAAAQFRAQGVEKLGIQVHLLIQRAIKRPHGRLARAAGRGRVAAEQNQLGLDVVAARIAKEFVPHHFGVTQHGAGELQIAVVGGRLGAGRFGLR